MPLNEIQIGNQILEMSTETPKDSRVDLTDSSPKPKERRVSGGRMSLPRQADGDGVDVSRFENPRDYARYRLKRLVSGGSAGEESDRSRDRFSDLEEYIEHRLQGMVDRARRSVESDSRGPQQGKQPQAHSTPKTPDSFLLAPVPEYSLDSVSTLDRAILEESRQSLDDMGLPKLKLCSTLPVGQFRSKMPPSSKLNKRVSFAANVDFQSKSNIKDGSKVDSPWPGRKTRSSLDAAPRNPNILRENPRNNVLTPSDSQPKSRIPVSSSHNQSGKTQNCVKPKFMPKNRTSPVTINPLKVSASGNVPVKKNQKESIRL